MVGWSGLGSVRGGRQRAACHLRSVDQSFVGLCLWPLSKGGGWGMGGESWLDSGSGDEYGGHSWGGGGSMLHAKLNKYPCPISLDCSCVMSPLREVNVACRMSEMPHVMSSIFLLMLIKVHVTC